MAGGIVVTRAASDYSLGADIGKQMFRTARPLWIVSGCLLSLALIPGHAEDLLHRSRRSHDVCGLEDEARSRQPKRRAQPRPQPQRETRPQSPAVDPMDAVLKLDDLMLEVGVGLVPLVDAKQGGQLLARVKSLRKNLAQTLGFLVPRSTSPTIFR